MANQTHRIPSVGVGGIDEVYIDNGDSTYSLRVATTQSPSDSSGFPTNPDKYAHTYTYDGSNQLITDVFNDGTHTWTKTYTWTSNNMTAESAWVMS